jgi:hypothetical protein
MPNYDNFDTEMESHYQETEGGAFDAICEWCCELYDIRDGHKCDIDIIRCRDAYYCEQCAEWVGSEHSCSEHDYIIPVKGEAK